MFSFTINTQTIAQYSHRINKITANLLQSPSKGYSGSCPFLRSISSITTGGAENLNATSETKSLFADAEYVDQSADESYEQQQQQQQLSQHLHHHQHQQQQEYRDRYTTHRQHQQQQVQQREFNQSQERRAFKLIDTKKHRHHRNDQEAKNDNCYDYNTRLKELIEAKKADESYRIFRKVRRFSNNFPHGEEQGKPVTIWCSNDYFGMSSHPKVRQAIAKALDDYGAGSGGTRNIAGNSPIHEQLEWDLADLHEKEAALLFSSCYVANDSTLFTLLKLLPNCHILSDAGNHASMIQGIRNSAAPRHIFKSFDPVDLEEKLKQLPISTPKIVAFETVHSMTGDISDVGRMCDISHKYGALTFVDEVHAVGLYGKHGAGIAQRDGCMDKIDIVSGTLGKAYGNFGGYVAASAELIDVIRSYASGFIFTTSLPPTVTCGATESVRILKGEEGRQLREMQQNNVFHMKRALTAAGLPHYPSKSHIIPIPVGNAAKCTRVSNDLLDMGHYIQSINYPTVPKGSERLRVSVTPFHNERMIDNLIENIVKVWRRNELNFLPPVELINSKCRRHQVMGQLDTRVGHSLWCELCHRNMDLSSKTAIIG